MMNISHGEHREHGVGSKSATLKSSISIYALQISAILLVLMMWTCLTDISAQDTYTPPKISAKATKDLEAAVLLSKAGQYDNAILTIKSLIEKHPTWTQPRQELSRIYYEQGKKEEAIQSLEATLRIDTVSQLKQLYSLARLYEETGDVDRAIATYKSLVMQPGAEAGLTQKARDNCQALKTKKALFTPSYTIQPEPFPALINTTHHEALGRWSLDGMKMIFTRMTEGQEDLFIASMDSQGSNWTISDFPHNTLQNEGAHAISPNGKYLVFTSCNRPDGMGSCDLYISVFKHGAWNRPVNMGPGFNSPAWDGHPCFGVDGTTLYFSSSRDGTFGGRDIWYMQQVASDSWSRPINAGPQINSADNEQSPFVHFDGKSMYFMRDGKEGLGGFDIYIARTGLDGKWQKPENLGAPINSGENEGALSLHPDGRHAIITRESGDQRNDLFQIELPEKFRAYPQQQLIVTVKDRLTGAPVHANLEIFELHADPSIRLSQWADTDGHIITSLQRNIDYGIIAGSPEYLMYSANLPADTMDMRTLDILMVPLEKAISESIILENVLFETASAEIKPESETELNKLLYTLKTNKGMIIEIQGHTDDVGDDAFNMELSTARAQSVHLWVVNKGIPPHRVTYKGYGETKPIADNGTPEGRRRNRRTAFEVLTK